MKKNSFAVLGKVRYRLNDDQEKRIREMLSDAEPDGYEGAITMNNGHIKLLLAVLSILLLVLVSAFVVQLVQSGWVDKPEVSIVFNVGEIIGGTLVGLGAIIASSWYVFKD